MLEEAEELNVQLSTELEKVQDRLKEKEAFISDFTVRSYNAQQFDINIAPHGSLLQQQQHQQEVAFQPSTSPSIASLQQLQQQEG